METMVFVHGASCLGEVLFRCCADQAQTTLSMVLVTFLVVLVGTVTITVVPLRPVTVPELRALEMERTWGSAETELVDGQVVKSR